MASEYKKFKKDSKYFDFFESKNSYKNCLSEGSIRSNSKLLADINTKKENAPDKEEKVLKKKESMDNLKSFSSKNLLKIKIKNDSENLNPNNINIAPNNESNNTKTKELYDNLDKVNSIEDYNKGEGDYENAKKETEEEKKLVQNNMEKELIDSKDTNNKAKENKIKEEFSLTEENKSKNSNNISSTNVITANDLGLNFDEKN